eukprot:TRINITY_DN7873_c0_g1_i1.p1 TRINITY_DN7873_c0_g1~~TRINITY_DN7873_c0_g1_i1.p1  ORF type:complete len:238 (+),score=29.68 TRINITY_DN7873_c0_g1_i1:1077-1790(+)
MGKSIFKSSYFFRMKAIIEADFIPITDFLAKLSMLETLDLSFKDFTLITDDCLRHLSDAISNLALLKSLRLSLENCTKITSQGFVSLASITIFAHNIEQIDFDFAWMNLTDNDMSKDFFSGLRQLRSLTKLKLTLSNCRHISNKTLQNMSALLRQNHILNDFELTIQKSNHINDDGLRSFYGILKTLPNLNRILIDFNWCYITRLPATIDMVHLIPCLLYTSPSPRDRQKSRMPSSA